MLKGRYNHFHLDSKESRKTPRGRGFPLLTSAIYPSKDFIDLYSTLNVDYTARFPNN
jgi:hypothetical protein